MKKNSFKGFEVFQTSQQISRLRKQFGTDF